MIEVAQRLYSFLVRNNIDPADVQLVIRSKNDETLCRVECALKESLFPFQLQQMPEGVRKIKLHGISISLTSLDHSR